MDPLTISSRLVIPGSAITFQAVRASGPGGQNVNKVSSKVELAFDVAATTLLSESEKTRLRDLAGSALDSSGILHVSSQATRDQSRNLADARAKLAELIARALVVPKKRRKTKPTRGSKERRLAGKKEHSQKKASRGDRSFD